MLHELLFALNGFPGSIFTEKNGTFSVVKGLPFLHPSEAAILDKLCSLGYQVKHLRNFASSHLSPGTDGGGGPPSKTGLYLHALCMGMQKVLGRYSHELLLLEAEALEGQLSLMCFQGVLDKYQLLFVRLLDVTSAIESGKVRGCSILQLVHAVSATGFPIAKESAAILLQECYGVLCQQISSWILHGVLWDPHHEFFVQQPDRSAAAQATSPTVEGPLESMDDFVLEPELLPDQLPASFAKKVLFAGSAVRVFGQSMGRPVFYGAEKEAEFVDRLREIQESPELDLLRLGALVEDVRSAAAAHLWQLLVERGCLLAQLRLMRDAFLLGRAELFLHFSQLAEPLLARPRTPTTEQEVNGMFQLACGLLQSEDENLAEQFHITVGPPLATAQDGPPLAGWETIGLSYAVKWPLHVFFTPTLLAKYSRLFRLLIGVQRAQSFLQDCWLLQSKLARCPPLRDCPLMGRMMQLRSHMAHLLDSLQYYLQVDVVESHLGRLLSQVKDTQDFEAIQHLHNSYLASLLADSMLMLRPVHECLRAILGLCQSLCAIFPTSRAPLTQRQFTQFEGIHKDFDGQRRLLLRILSSLHTRLPESQVSQLLLRLSDAAAQH